MGIDHPGKLRSISKLQSGETPQQVTQLEPRRKSCRKAKISQILSDKFKNLFGDVKVPLPQLFQTCLPSNGRKFKSTAEDWMAWSKSICMYTNVAHDCTRLDNLSRERVLTNSNPKRTPQKSRKKEMTFVCSEELLRTELCQLFQSQARHCMHDLKHRVPQECQYKSISRYIK